MVEGEAVGSLRAQSARRDGAKALQSSTSSCYRTADAVMLWRGGIATRWQSVAWRRRRQPTVRWYRYEVTERSRSSWYRAAYGAVVSLRGDRAF